MRGAIQLELIFTEAVPSAKIVNLPSVDLCDVATASDYDAMAERQGIEIDTLNPCAACQLREVCDADDCGQHLYKLDVHRSDSVSWDSYWHRQYKRIGDWLASNPVSF